MTQKTSLLLVLWSTLAFGQITKEQIYELVDKRVDASIIVTMIQQNCISFEADGATVVELSTRVPGEVLKAVVDCNSVAIDSSEVQSPAAAKAAAETTTTASSTERFSLDAFRVHPYITFVMSSNKSSYNALEVELRLIDSSRPNSEPIIFRHKGQANEDGEIRGYKASGVEFVEPGNYVGYLYVVSERNRGMLARKTLRTDIHHMMVEYQGSGPIKFTYESKEERTFKSKKEIEIITSGPMVIHSEEQAGFEGLRSFDEVIRLFSSK